MKKDLVLFDFDGTITTKDTFLEFIKFYKGKTAFYTGFLLYTPVMILFKLGLIPNWRAKEHMITLFFAKEKRSDINQKGAEFCEHLVPKIVRKGALEAIKEYQNQDSDIFVVSASAENWVKPWCENMGVGLIATRLEEKNGVITGKIAGKNCYGPEKVNRVCEQINLSDYNKIIAYGDSRGDKEMLALASNQFFKPFRNV